MNKTKIKTLFTYHERSTGPNYGRPPSPRKGTIGGMTTLHCNALPEEDDDDGH